MKKIFVVFCIMLLCVTGCNNNLSDIESTTTGGEIISGENKTTEVSTTDLPTTSVTDRFEPITDKERGEGQLRFAYGTGDAKRLGVDKTVVWITSDVYCPEEDVVLRFNELLVNKYGCDFVVEFRAYMGIQNFQSEYKYYDMITDMMKLGHRADILFSGNFSDYSNFVEAGVYESLDEYFITDEGQKLYEAYAPEIWKKVERNGNTYGYLSEIYPADRAAALCNEEIAKKYGIAVPEGEWSFYDVGRYIEAAGVTQADISTQEVLLAAWPNALILMEGYYECLTLFNDIYFKADGTGGWTAVDLSKEEGFIKLVKTIKEYSDKGWYTCLYNLVGEEYSNESSGRFVFDFVAGTQEGIKFTKNKFVCNDYTVCDVTSGKTSYGAVERMENMINGVTSWAEYKDEALKLITLVNTESELSNLLQYGIEGVDYEYKDRLVKSLSSSRYDQIPMPTISSAIANINILHNVLADPDDKVAYSKEISKNCPDGVTMMYDIDMSGYEAQMEKISEIYTKYEKKLFKAEYDDVEAAVAEMGAALAEAGMDEVIAELNRQMKGQ